MPQQNLTGDEETPPLPLARALGLLGGLLERDDVPTAVRMDLTDAIDDLADISPLSQAVPPSDRADRPWPAVVQEVIAVLYELAHPPDPAGGPAVTLRHALVLRALHDTAWDAARAAAAPARAKDGPDPSAGAVQSHTSER